MRLFRTVAAVAALLIGLSASAQNIGSTRLGVTGGFTSSDSNADIFKTSSYSLYHAGVTFQYPFAAGFAIQPAVVYQVKGSTLDGLKDSSLSDIAGSISNLRTKVGFVEIPVQLQWGPDLLAFRPYVFAEPFVGFAVNTANKLTVASVTAETVKDFGEAAIKRLEYGVGFGAGIEFSRFQISGRYYVNFGTLYNESGEITPVGETIKAAYKNGRNFNGFSLSAAVFF